jgi:hypothetical protein
MATPTEPFDAVGNASTLLGVVVGALVATLGAFAAASYERRVLRREREADTALVFGELLRTIAIQITLVRAAHGRGDPFGPITIRMTRAVRREIDIYDRNRERLFFVRDAALRPRTAALMARLTFALDRVLDSTEALASATDEDQRRELALARGQAFEFMAECADELPALVDSFAALAKAPIAEYDLQSIGFGRPGQDEA